MARHYQSWQRSGLDRYTPQPPPSPPMDEIKYSLPSISKLLGIADAGFPTSTASHEPLFGCVWDETTDIQSQHKLGTSWVEPHATHTTASQSAIAAATTSRQRGNLPTNTTNRSSSCHHTEQNASQFGTVPLTPPPGADYFDNHRCPVNEASRQLSIRTLASSNKKLLQITPAPTHGEDSSSLQARQPMPVAQRAQLSSLLSQQLPSEARQTTTSDDDGRRSRYPQVHLPSPASNDTPSSSVQISDLCYQQLLPQTLFRVKGADSYASASIIGPGPWQHHHYLNPVHGSITYLQSPDRYMCPTCSKTFSRPSSLRIHSHSHTGEKPYKCPRAGCGKAFSVRSNMKRHERGCHTFSIHADRHPSMRAAIQFN